MFVRGRARPARHSTVGHEHMRAGAAAAETGRTNYNEKGQQRVGLQRRDARSKWHGSRGGGG